MSKEAPYYRLAMRIFTDFSGTIAVPAVAAALFGKWLDGRYGTAPRYMILLLVIAFACTSLIVIRKAKAYRKSYEALLNREQKERL